MKKLFYVLSILFAVHSGQFLFAQDIPTEQRISGTNVHYEPEDWTTFPMTRWITSLAVGREYVYFGSTGGIIRYNIYSNRWERPWTVSDGLPDNNILSIAYDENTDYVWCSTRLGAYQFVRV